MTGSRFMKFSIAILVIIVFISGVHRLSKRWVAEKLWEQDGIHFEDIDIDIFRGKLVIDDLCKEWPDSLDNQMTLLRTDKLRADISKWWKLYNDNANINFNYIQLKHPKLEVHRFVMPANEPEARFSSQLANVKLDIKKLKADKANITLLLHGDTTFSIKNIKLDVRDLIKVKDRSLRWGHLKLKAGRLHVADKSQLHEFVIDSTIVRSEDHRIRLINIKLIPRFSESNLYQILEHRSSLVTLSAPEILVEGWQQDSLFEKPVWVAKTIRAKHLNCRVFDDTRIPPCPSCYKEYPHEILQKSNLKLRLDSIDIDSSFFAYVVANSDNHNNAKIYFSELSLDGGPAYTINEPGTDQHAMQFNINSSFMGSRSFPMRVDFNLQSKKLDYFLQGRLSNFDLTRISPLMEMSEDFRIDSCDAHNVIFRIFGDKYAARGDMVFQYENLKVKRLNDNQKPSFLSSLFTNLVIRNNNLPGSPGYVTGNVYYERKTNRSLFHQWAGALNSGFRSVILPNALLKEELKREK